METQEKLKRWRLILGKEAEQTLEQMASGEMLSQEDLLMDRALGATMAEQTASAAVPAVARPRPSCPAGWAIFVRCFRPWRCR
ncbi:MAG: hypothetical protein ACLUSL_04765 [Ruminococcus sp.]